MRTVALLALTGCRAVLGIEDVSVVNGNEIDAPIGNMDSFVDAPVDALLVGCPSNFINLPNSGPRGHRYLLVSSSREWVVQRDTCAANTGFLAFPDGTAATTELTAIVTLAGGTTWIGINDIQTEGTYLTSLNTVISSSTAALIGSSGGPGQKDCIRGSTSSMTDESCNVAFPAVCECVP